MTQVPASTPLTVFEDNIGDAERLIQLTRALLNTRTYRMRKEKRQRVGEALRIPLKNHDELDCAESDALFVVMKPGGVATRDHFTEPELRPLLRQSVVAIAAAIESYVAEKACCYIAEALKATPQPARLLSMPLTLEDALLLEHYERRGWGHRKLIKAHLEREASASSRKIGEVFSTVGRKGFWPKVDGRRKVTKGTSEKQLDELAERRNRIAHSGDRVGRGRAQLDVSEVDAHFGNAKSIVEALDAVL